MKESNSLPVLWCFDAKKRSQVNNLTEKIYSSCKKIILTCKCLVRWRIFLTLSRLSGKNMFTFVKDNILFQRWKKNLRDMFCSYKNKGNEMCQAVFQFNCHIILMLTFCFLSVHKTSVRNEVKRKKITAFNLNIKTKLGDSTYIVK